MSAETYNNNHKQTLILTIIISVLTIGLIILVISYLIYIENQDHCDTSNQMQLLKNDLVLICNKHTCLEKNTTIEKIELWCSYVTLLAENMKN